MPAAEPIPPAHPPDPNTPNAPGLALAPALPAVRRRRFWTARRAWVLIAGTTVVITGVIISPLPGPGLSILGPIGFGILATEFAWARYAMAHVNRHEATVRVHTDRIAGRISRWFILPVVLAYWAGVWALADKGPFNPLLVWGLSSPAFIPVAYVSLRIAKARAQRKAARRAALVHAAGTTSRVELD